ncbi:mitogen-activated protein kinase kinase kinase 5-like isoform X2 [Humulus lupulus]|uniref:mitogen-activated protein kinase kinase kinase 5-like isoform X2 n=1 Tax=Humulus lupulus TaxID=3486 RepID=UPI002B413FC0|nr:mitogen-activated protein kinase kinase kinase 5-like isoform X2 [Humulus lupulus]
MALTASPDLAFPNSQIMPSPNSHNDSISVFGCTHSSSSGTTVNTKSFSDLGERRLTRQRKLRYVTDQELGITHLNERSSRSSPTSPDSDRKSSSPRARHWSFSAVPHPLPLPDSPMVRRPESAPEGFDSPFRRKDPDQSAIKLTKTPRKCQRRFSHDSNVHDIFTPNVVSTKGTAISIPNTCPVSPKRSNTGDTLSSSHVPNNGFPVSPISPKRSNGGAISFSHFPINPPNIYRNLQEPTRAEVHNLRVNVPSKSAPSSPRRSRADDRELQNILATGNSRTLSPVRIRHSVDHYPSNSPATRNDHNTPKSPKRNSFPFPHNNKRLLTETSAERPDQSNSHPNAHPLPLPPGATLSSQPVTLHRNTDVSSMKGQWQKGKLIGRGTFGSVYMAMNRKTGALCAMKEVDLIPDDPKSAECVKQLEQEIKVLRELDHPNIVRYYGCEKIEDHFYIYLEYVHPGSINKYVREHCGAVTVSVVRNFTRHILSGLAYLHSKQTIHRDIKGANLLVNSSGVVKLADFGMAKHLTGLSYELSMKGSPYWMAPELIRAVMQNSTNPDHAYAVDIWSLGCTIIEMMNGRPPWSDFTGPQAMFKVLNRTPPIPETLSSEGKDFLNICFRRNPAERLSAAALLEHPFVVVRKSHNNQHVSSTSNNFSEAMKLVDDRMHGQSDRRSHHRNQVGMALQGKQVGLESHTLVI